MKFTRWTIPSLLVWVGLSLSLPSNAQYRTAVGVRFNNAPSLTIKHHLTKNNALEGLLMGYGNGLTATLLYEIHQGTGEKGLRWYYGAGGHLGVWREGRRRYGPYYVGEGGFHLGVDGILGIEYTFSGAPFNISLDWKPAFQLIGNPGLYLGDVGLSLRFAIK